MPKEIERKFLVRKELFDTSGLKGKYYSQGYIYSENAVVRIRISEDSAYISIKGATHGISRLEYEYKIPMDEAKELLHNFCSGSCVEKIRYLSDVDGHTWEIDEFLGKNSGLLMAEIELSSEDEKFTLPGWAEKEVSQDPRYYNSNLAKHPFTEWQDTLCIS